MSIVQPFLHRHSSLDLNFWMLVREFIKLIYTITLNAASSFTDIYMKDHWFKTNSWWLWQIKSILIPVWYFCYDYMIVTFEVTIWSKTLIHSTAAYRASHNGSLRKYFFFFFCIFVWESLETKTILFLLFHSCLIQLRYCTSNYLCPLRSVSCPTTNYIAN